MAVVQQSYTATEPHLTQSAMLAIIWLEAFLAGMFVIGRLWIRLKIDKGLKWDDFLTFLAFACLIIMCGLYIDAIPRMYVLIDVVDGVQAPGPGFEAQQSIFLREQFAIIIFFWTTIWSVKFSFLAFYRRMIDRRIQKWKIYAWGVVLGVCIVTYLGCLATQFGSCWPLYTYFKLGACQTTRDIYISNFSLFYSTAVDVACDILIMALPFSVLRELIKAGRAGRRQNVELGCIFSVGIIIIIFAVLRVVYTRPSIGHVDPKWLCIMSITESSVAVMVSCAPPLRRLYTSTKDQSNRWSSHATRSRKSARSTETDEERSTSQIALQESWSRGSQVSTRSEKFVSPERMAHDQPIASDQPSGESTLQRIKASMTTHGGAWLRRLS